MRARLIAAEMIYVRSASSFRLVTAATTRPKPPLLRPLRQCGPSIKASTTMSSMTMDQITAALSMSSCSTGSTDLIAESCQIRSRPTGLPLLFIKRKQNQFNLCPKCTRVSSIVPVSLIAVSALASSPRAVTIETARGGSIGFDENAKLHLNVLSTHARTHAVCVRVIHALSPWPPIPFPPGTVLAAPSAHPAFGASVRLRRIPSTASAPGW